MLKGTIIFYEPTQRLCIDGELSTQNFVTLRDSCIKQFDLKVGDKVLYDGMNHSTVFVKSKIN